MISHKIALDPNNAQATYFARASGTARFAYNWALAEWQRQYEARKIDPALPRPTQMSLRRKLNSIKREQFPWMMEVTKCAQQEAIIQLGEAFKNYFAGRAGHPKFRRKGGKDRFTITNDQFVLDGKRIRIPNLGWVRMREALRFDGNIMSATVSRVADRWFVGITVDASPIIAENQGVIGVDLGVKSLATLSNGEVIPGPKAHKALLPRMRRLSRSLARKVKGSRNRKKAQMKLARLHARISSVRKDSLHKLTTDLARRFHTIGIENLNVRGMVSNRRLARSVSDMGFFEFRNQLTYKAANVVVADRWFPSSKTCSCCGSIKEKLSLSERIFICEDCGHTQDRDLNAAINLEMMAVSSTVSACGEEGSGPGRKTETKPTSMKQESSGNLCVSMEGRPGNG